MYPEDYLYSKDHEWISVQDGEGIIGITDYAQHEMGDVVYVDLPEVGDSLEANEPFGSVESVKAVSEIFAAVSGEIIEVNSKLWDSPEMINESPYEEGWVLRIEPSNWEEDKARLMADEETLTEWLKGEIVRVEKEMEEKEEGGE